MARLARPVRRPCVAGGRQRVLHDVHVGNDPAHHEGAHPSTAANPSVPTAVSSPPTSSLELGIRTVIVGPMYHPAPNWYALNALRADGLVVLPPRFDPEGLLRLIEQHRISHL